jgi:TonB family protein
LKEPGTLLLSKKDALSEAKKSDAVGTTKVLSPPTLSPDSTSALTSSTLFGASNETYSQPERISPRLAWSIIIAVLIIGSVGIFYVTSSTADKAEQSSSSGISNQENNSFSDNQNPLETAPSDGVKGNVREANKTASGSTAAPVSGATPITAGRTPGTGTGIGVGRDQATGRGEMTGMGPGNSGGGDSPRETGEGGGIGPGGGGPGAGGGETDYSRVFKPSETTRKAIIISRPEPGYTEEARKNLVTGTVILRMIFYSSGAVGNITVVKGLPYGLTEKAIAATKRIKFSPAIKDGRPVSQYIQVEYTFNLY